MARGLALAGSLALLLGALPAPAAPPGPRIHGPYCGPAGCPATPRSGLGAGAGFATAVATALLLARRRRPEARPGKQAGNSRPTRSEP
jgi:hypothetical protein